MCNFLLNYFRYQNIIYIDKNRIEGYFDKNANLGPLKDVIYARIEFDFLNIF